MRRAGERQTFVERATGDRHQQKTDEGEGGQKTLFDGPIDRHLDTEYYKRRSQRGR